MRDLLRWLLVGLVILAAKEAFADRYIDGVPIPDDAAVIAADPCRGDNVVEKSLRLLSGFELRRSKRPFPEVAMKPPH